MNILIRKILAVSLAFMVSVCLMMAQGIRERNDSIIYRQSAFLDSTLVGKDIFKLLSAAGANGTNVTVHQSRYILDAFEAHVAANPSRTSTGFRVRIFNDNRQTSRKDSETALERFRGMFPGISAYRTYSNPFFRVTVGDFRTKSEAMQLLQQVKAAFPTAFIVREAIGYPVADRLRSFTVETVNQE